MKIGKPETMERRDTAETERLALERVQARKDDVAAHQAKCRCHPARSGCCGLGRPGTAIRASDIAVDSHRFAWHLDPGCRIRPEAVAVAGELGAWIGGPRWLEEA